MKRVVLVAVFALAALFTFSGVAAAQERVSQICLDSAGDGMTQAMKKSGVPQGFLYQLMYDNDVPVLALRKLRLGQCFAIKFDYTQPIPKHIKAYSEYAMATDMEHARRLKLEKELAQVKQEKSTVNSVSKADLEKATARIAQLEHLLAASQQKVAALSQQFEAAKYENKQLKTRAAAVANKESESVAVSDLRRQVFELEQISQKREAENVTLREENTRLKAQMVKFSAGATPPAGTVTAQIAAMQKQLQDALNRVKELEGELSQTGKFLPWPTVGYLAAVLLVVMLGLLGFLNRQHRKHLKKTIETQEIRELRNALQDVTGQLQAADAAVLNTEGGRIRAAKERDEALEKLREVTAQRDALVQDNEALIASRDRIVDGEKEAVAATFSFDRSKERIINGQPWVFTFASADFLSGRGNGGVPSVAVRYKCPHCPEPVVVIQFPDGRENDKALEEHGARHQADPSFATEQIESEEQVLRPTVH